MRLDDVLGTIDERAFGEIRERYGDPSQPAHREKYLNLRQWIEINLERVRAIGLHRGGPRRVLDLGCGCGYFLYICKLLGHDVLGVDVPERRSLYTEVRELLGIPTVSHAIRSFAPLPKLGGPFDVVTAYMVTFNAHGRVPWGPDEWRFLLDELGAPLVYLELNAEPDGTLFPPGLREMFEERGAVVRAHRVLIDRRGA